jgi:hypothetical protein
MKIRYPSQKILINEGHCGPFATDEDDACTIKMEDSIKTLCQRADELKAIQHIGFERFPVGHGSARYNVSLQHSLLTDRFLSIVGAHHK